jgi:dienelactone hydrolase
MLLGRRSRVTRTPAEAGLPYEDVTFRAGDGVRLEGWLIPRDGDGPGPAIVFVHGWMWNRVGNVAGQVPFGDRDVDFMPAAKALHDAGFHVLLFDLRHHGDSEAGRMLMSYGPIEARDFVGAVSYLRSRPDVDGQRIGAVGMSMGGNIVLYGVPDCQPIKAVLAIQPTKLSIFNANFCRAEFGRFGPALLKPVELLYRLLRQPWPSRQDPAVPASTLGEDTIVRYVQGTGDPWGTIAAVEAFAAATPVVDGPVIQYPSEGRYEGYQYLSKRTDEIVGFLTKHV